MIKCVACSLKMEDGLMMFQHDCTNSTSTFDKLMQVRRSGSPGGLQTTSKNFIETNQRNNLKEKSLDTRDESDPKNKLNTCSVCSFSSKKNLRSHYCRVHFKKQILETNGNDDHCTICDKKDFRHKNMLVSHVGLAHKVVDKLMAKAEAMKKKRFHCHLCDFAAKKRNLLYAHYCCQHYKQDILRELEGHRNCPECKLKIDQKYKLIFHVGVVHDYLDRFLPKEFQIAKHSRHKMKKDASTDQGDTASCQRNSGNTANAGNGQSDSDSSQSKGSNSVSSQSNQGKSVSSQSNEGKEESHDCSLCTFSSCLKQNLTLHYSLCHFRQDILKMIKDIAVCSICGYEAKSQKLMIRHYGLRHGCVKKFLSKTRTSKESINLATTCQLCNFKPTNMTQHYCLIHFRSEILSAITNIEVCSLCGFQAGSESRMIKHYGGVHNYVDDLLAKALNKRKSGEKECVCTICDYKTDTKAHLTSHYSLLHFKEEILMDIKDESSCGLCDHKSKSKFNLIVHYGGIHNYVTDLLAKRDQSLKEDSSNNHESDQASYTCYICKSHSSLNRYQLYAHYSIKHFREELVERIDDRTSCDLCKKAFTKVKNDNIKHLGVSHSLVDQFIPKQYQVPKKHCRFPNDPDTSFDSESTLGDAQTTQLCTDDKVSIKNTMQNNIKSDASLNGGGRSCIREVDKSFDSEGTQSLLNTEDHLMKSKQDENVTYDCYICNDYSSSNRSKMYLHYSTQHFREEMMKRIDSMTNCQLCEKAFSKSNTDNMKHMGVAHSLVDQFIPKQHQIPKKYCKVQSGVLDGRSCLNESEASFDTESILSDAEPTRLCIDKNVLHTAEDNKEINNSESYVCHICKTFSSNTRTKMDDVKLHFLLMWLLTRMTGFALFDFLQNLLPKVDN